MLNDLPLVDNGAVTVVAVATTVLREMLHAHSLSIASRGIEEKG